MKVERMQNSNKGMDNRVGSNYNVDNFLDLYHRINQLDGVINEMDFMLKL